MTKFIASIVLAATVLAGVSAAQAGPNTNAKTFFADLARNGN
jgi:hypothetical protein